MAKSKGRNQALFDTTHRGVLEAARVLFVAYGYAGVATQRIAETAGVAHGSVFHHFKSKRDLFIAVHQPYQERLLEWVAAAADAAPEPRARLDRICRAYLDIARDPGIRRILLQDGPQVIGPGDLRDAGRPTAFALLTREIEQLMKAGLLLARPARGLAVVLFGALNQAASEIADFPEDAALREALIAETTALVAALR